MEFMGNLYQFGQSGILTFRDGIQEGGGLIPFISASTSPWKPSVPKDFSFHGETGAMRGKLLTAFVTALNLRIWHKY